VTPIEELVRAASEGDLASFGVLYERYYRLAVSIARARVADVHLAEDAAQEAFVIAFRTLATLRDRRQFPQWLTTICRRTASRMQAKRPAHESLVESLASEPGSHPVRDTQSANVTEQVQEALQQLDEESREFVVLHYFGKLTYQEISDATGVTVAGVHGRLQRSRTKLAELLDTPIVRKD